jgi:histidinol phosphatase-like enzyme (inositol monophosphatase family)
MNEESLSSRLELARRVAREAGYLTLNYFQRPNVSVERKADNSPVTVADREAEQHLRKAIAQVFPDDGIVGEEFGEERGASGYRWILDPIDGTKSFISGVPLYGTMVAVDYDGQAVLGVVYIPGLDECVYAARGQGAWFERSGNDAVPARVSSRPTLAEGLFVTSQVDLFARRRAGEAFDALQKRAYITRTWGDCYGYLLVATGRAEAMVDPELNVWDAAAVQPIIEEAGGTFTDWRGAPSIYTGDAVGTNGLVHNEVLDITNCPKPW